jgi:hypothetical protein
MSGALSSPGFDPAIALQAGRGVAPPNPLQTVGQFANTMNAINQTKLFPGQMELQNQDITRNTVQNAQMINRAAYASIAHLLNKPEGSITHTDVTNAMASAEANLGLPTHGPISDLGRIMPGADGPDFDRSIRDLILARTQPAERAAAAVVPSLSLQPVGDQAIPYRTPQGGQAGAGNPTQAGPGISLGVSPEFKANQVGRPATAMDVAKLHAQGIEITVNTPLTVPMVDVLYQQGALPQSGQRVPQGGVPGSMGPGNYPAPSPAAPPTSPPGTMPTVPAVRAPASAPGTIPLPPGAGGTPVVTGLPPGTAESNAADVAAYKAAQMGLPERQTAVQSLIKAKEALELVNTGRGSDTLNRMKSLILTLTPGANPNEVSVMNYDLAHKYLVDYARRAAGAGGTDLARQLGTESNASTDPISNAAALNVVKTNIGRERQGIAGTMLAPSTGIGYGAHIGNHANDTDPRAFAFDHYTPQERQALITELKKDPAAWKKFQHSLELAARTRQIAVPGSQ